MKMLRSLLVLAPLALFVAPALAQETHGTSPLTGSKGGTNNAFMQFSGPAAALKTYTLPNASGTIGVLNGIGTWTAAQSFTDGTVILLGSSSGSSTIKAPATGGGAATLFPGADTIAGIAATQTLTNKTFNCVNNTCTVRIGTDVTGLGGGVATALSVGVNGSGGLVTFSGVLGTPSSGTATNLTGTAAGLTAGNVTTNANLTGPITSVGNATAIGANQVTRANEAQGVARSVVGVAGNATANVADIQGTTPFTILGVNSAGTALGFVSARQILGFSNSAVALPQATTLFSGFVGNASETLVTQLCPITGTFKNLSVAATAPASGQTLIATLRVNLADTAVTCTITGVATTCSDTTHSAACPLGGLWDVKLVTSATTGTLAFVGGGVEFDNP